MKKPAYLRPIDFKHGRIDMNHGAAQRTEAAVTAKDANLMKKLREENSYLRNLLEKYATKNPELKPSLHKYEPDADKPAPPAP